MSRESSPYSGRESPEKTLGILDPRHIDFGANSSALVLVDGIERDFNEINVEDIESFSVLKDASATAIYGQRGANGVVLITTKRGKEGKVNINFKTEYGISSSAFEREFVDAGTYAALANEAA